MLQMAGTVFLRTNRFEVKLEAITFKTNEFDQLCTMDFLFPKGKVWKHPPVVGLDVIRHPRDPNIVLMLLCFGVGCVILRFCAGDCLSEPILNFLTDKRIHFVGFGIPEKSHLLPFDELGLSIYKTDAGYMAAKLRNNAKYAKCDLAELSRKVLGIKEMMALTEASSFERHEKIKCAMCQLFLSSVIAMTLLRADSKNILGGSPRKISFLKRFNSMQLLNEGWSKITKGKEDVENKLSEVVHSYYGDRNDAYHGTLADDLRADSKNILRGSPKKISALKRFSSTQWSTKGKKDNENKLSEVVYSYYGVPDDAYHDTLADDSLVAKVWECYGSDDFFPTKISEDESGDDSVHVREGGRLGDAMDNESVSGDETPCKENASSSTKPLKGILKCPHSNKDHTRFSSPISPTALSPSRSRTCPALKRANSKGHNVTFKCDTGSL